MKTFFRFLENGVYINAEKPLQLASCGGHAEIVDLLINHGVNVNERNPYGETALEKSAENGHIDVVQVLLEQPHLKINNQNNYGNTALSRVVVKNRFEVSHFFFCIIFFWF